MASRCLALLRSFLPDTGNGKANDLHDNDVDDHAITKIRLVNLKDRKDGKRDWDIEVIHNCEIIHRCRSLQDKIKPEEYSDIFEFAATKSLIIKEKDKTEDHSDLVEAAKDKIQKYGEYLVNKAGVDDQAQYQKNRSIFIVEEIDKNDDDEESLHNPVWEQLENLDYWQHTKPELVNVTRTLHHSEDREEEESSESDSRQTVNSEPDQITQLAPEDPVRILLATGRHLYHYDEKGNPYDEQAEKGTSYRYEDITPGIIQCSIRQVIRHLKEIGFNRQVHLDIVRPGTFDKFKSYLEEDGVMYDLIHLDMHAEMKKDDVGLQKPHFRFLEVKMGPRAFVPASEVASTLAGRTNLLVWNACNESSAIGGLGIGMIRQFLMKKGIACIAATSYKLLVPTAEIFYPSFYMSLLVKNSFNRAAADGRQALKDRQDRYGEKRDDSYVVWNWSSKVHHQRISYPQPPSRLYWKMVFESGRRFFSWMGCSVLLNWRAGNETHPRRFPMYHTYYNFRDIKSHVSCCSMFDIPKASLHAHEVEYFLTNNHLSEKDNHNSVYLYPGHECAGNEFEIIEILMKNMVRIWVETNFVIETRVVDVEKMVQEVKRPWMKFFRLCAPGYVNYMKRSDWTWRQQEQQLAGQRQPEIKGMLILCGIDRLLKDDGSRETVLNRIEEIAGEIKKKYGNFYAITAGRMRPKEWTNLAGKFAQKTIGEKWADPEIMLIPDMEDVQLSSYSWKR